MVWHNKERLRQPYQDNFKRLPNFVCSAILKKKLNETKRMSKIENSVNIYG